MGSKMALVLYLTAAACVQGALAANHEVDWKFTTAGYSQLAAAVGDTLTFKFSGGHDVVAVPSGVQWPASCSAPQGEDYGESGPIVVPLTKEGTVTYICTVPGHCQSGKMSVTVVVSPAAGPAPAPKLPPSPPPQTPPTPPAAAAPPARTKPTTSGPVNISIPWGYGTVPKQTINATVGDTLLFVFSSGHDVAQLKTTGTKWPGACNAPLVTKGFPITKGPAKVVVKNAGTFSFICTVPGHCAQGGMHVNVKVAARKAPTPSPKAKSPSPNKTSTP